MSSCATQCVPNKVANEYMHAYAVELTTMSDRLLYTVTKILHTSDGLFKTQSKFLQYSRIKNDKAAISEITATTAVQNFTLLGFLLDINLINQAYLSVHRHTLYHSSWAVCKSTRASQPIHECVTNDLGIKASSTSIPKDQTPLLPRPRHGVVKM